VVGEDGRVMTGDGFLSRHERLRTVASTNDVARDWLAGGTPEVCLAVADEQTAGRGRSGRSWISVPGRCLTLSLGFRPVYLAPERYWRLPAIVALAMADAAEEAAGLPGGTLRLKWPNDIVAEAGGEVRKVAGVLAETSGAGTAGVTAVVGIGINTDWAGADFPEALAATMTSLREIARGRPVEDEALLAGFMARLEPRALALRDGWFDVAGWHDRQVTTGRTIRVELPGGAEEEVRAVGVDGSSGALLVDDGSGERELLSGEVVHVRFGPETPAGERPEPAMAGPATGPGRGSGRRTEGPRAPLAPRDGVTA